MKPSKEKSLLTYKPFIAGIQDGVKHVFINKKVTHPLRDNHIHFRNRKLDFLNLPFQNRYNCPQK